MPKQKGDQKTGGRKKGTPNKLTKTIRESVFETFHELQQDKKANLTAWAKDHPKDFYTIAAKLIPQEIVNTGQIDVVHANKMTDDELAAIAAKGSTGTTGKATGKN